MFKEEKNSTANHDCKLIAVDTHDMYTFVPPNLIIPSDLIVYGSYLDC